MNVFLGLIVGVVHGVLFQEPIQVLPVALLAIIAFHLQDVKELLEARNETP